VLTVEEIIDQEREDGMRFGPFERWWLTSRAHVPERVRRNLELAARFPHLVGMPEQSFSGGVQGFAGVATAAFGAINTSNAELNMLGATQAIINKYCAIAPADVFPGKVYELRMSGVYGNTGTPTMIFTPRWGSSTTPGTNVSLGANSAWTSITGTTALPYRIVFELTILADPPGATAGTARGFGSVLLGIPTTSSQVTATIMIGGTSATIDTSGQGTAGCGLTMNLTWSASSASNTSTCQFWKLRSL
jgi:hypothetical protein